MNRVQAALHDQTVLITGATGFLGQPLVEKILWLAPTVRRIYTLIRPRHRLGGELEEPHERLERELLRSNVFDRLYYIHGERTQELLAEKVVAVAGDISQEGLGLDPDLRRRLQAEVNIIINSAAAVSFDAPLDEALLSNALSPGRIADFACRCNNPILVHVSTAYVGGGVSDSVPETLYHSAEGEEISEDYPYRKFSRIDDEIGFVEQTIDRLREEAGSRTVREALLRQAQKNRRRRSRPESDESLQRKWLQDQLTQRGMSWARQRGWNDTYTYTKAMGEQMVSAHHKEVPTVIIRPSVIESSLSEPTPGWLDGLRMADPLIVAIGKGRLRSLPLDADVTIDLIPVDMVVNALLASIPRIRNRGGLEIYHVATGATNPLTLGEMHDLVYDYFSSNPMLDRKGEPIGIKPLRFLNRKLFRMEHRIKTAPLRGVERTLRRLPSVGATGRFKRRISAAKTAYDRLYYYGEIYEPYLNLNSVFEVTNTQRLLASLNEDEREVLNFDVSKLNWRHYIQNVHIPGVKKHILKMEGTGALEIEEEPSTQNMTINSLVDRAAQKFPSKVALQIKRETGWHRLTYSELQRKSHQIGQSFRQMGLKKGDRVVLYSENKPEWGLSYLGATAAGLTVVPLDPQAWNQEVWGVVQYTEARALLATERCLDRLDQANLQKNENQPHPTRILNVDQMCIPFARAEYPLSMGVRPPQTPAQAALPALHPDDPVSIIFTNSTAVDPKGAIHTHRSFLSNLLGVNHFVPVAETDQLLSVLPLYHALEFTCGFLMAMYGGATLTYAQSLKPRAILESMRETGTTCMLGVPTLYALIREDIERRILKTPKSALKSNLLATSKQINLSVEKRLGKNIGRQLFARVHEEFGGRIRLFVSGGSGLGEALYRDFAALGMPIYEGYGLTETGPVLTVNPFQRSKKSSAGKPLPGVELRIFNPDKDGIGEIIARTPSLMNGYYKNPEATARVLKGGWFHTGDLAWVDTDGYIYITGRKKDVIVTGAGKNVYPQDLEAIYRTIADIRDICVLGVKSGLTEDVHAVIVPQAQTDEGNPKARKGLQRRIQDLAKRLPSYHRLQHLHLQAQPLPYTNEGVVDREEIYRRLIEQLERQRKSGQRKPSHQASQQQSREEELYQELGRLSGVPVEDIDRESHLYSDLGLDSLMAIEALLLLEARFKVVIPDEVAGELQTVGDLVEQVRLRRSDAEDGERTDQYQVPSAQDYASRSRLDRFLLTGACKALCAIYRTYLDLELIHPERLPTSEPFILAANHSSHLDTGALLAAIGTAAGVGRARQAHVLGAKDYFFNTPLKGWFFSTLLNVVPVEREEASLAGLRMARAILSRGEPLLIFPEGTRSRTGTIQEFRPGLGLIALDTGTPIVPVHIGGTYQAMPPGTAFPRPGRVVVSFGQPIRMDDYRQSREETPADERYRQIASVTQQAIQALAQARSQEQ